MPEALSPNAPPVTAKTADDINDLFKELDKEPSVPESEDKTPKKTKSEPEPEEESDDEDLKLVEPEEEAEKLDLKEEDSDIEFDAPPKKKEILAKYPDIFKTFPFLEKMIYRDRQYNELFGSFDDAKALAEKSEMFNEFETQLMSGNTETILKEIKDTDERAFNTIVDNYLPTLASVDKDAYFHVVGNLNKRLIMEMVQEANKTGNEDLKQAALYVNQFVFGTATFTAPEDRVKDKSDPKESEVEKERLNFVRERFESTRDELQSQVDNTLRATIDSYIDPKGVMSSYVKRNAIKDAMNYLEESISSDSTVQSTLNRLWRAAFDNKFSKDSTNRIRAFYLSKAKSNMRDAIMKARSEALKDLSPKREKEVEETDEGETPRQRRIAPGRPSQPKSKNEMKKGESVADFFMRD